MTSFDPDAAGDGAFPSQHDIPAPLRIPTAPVRGVIWHFSDLEFPPDGATFRDMKVGVEGMEIAPFQPYDVLLDYVGRRERWKGGILVVSGDFISGSAVERAVSRKDPDPAATRARYREKAFAHAAGFIEQLAERLTRSGDAGVVVVVCPGNQDVDLHAAAGSTPGAEPLSAYRAAVRDHVQPGKAPHTVYSGACMLALDTTLLTGRIFQLPKSLGRARRRLLKIQLDASLYDASEIENALALLRHAGTAERVEKGELLGIVVAHHPPSITPSSWLEGKPFETAVGAGQAKQKLARSGFRIFLHGHKHTAVVHEEAIFPGYPEPSDRVLVFGAPAFLAAGGEERGFSVIEFLVSPETGEACVLLHPHILQGKEPHARPVRRFILPPRIRAPAAVIRLSASIDAHGDCRLDSEYLEIPLPAEPTLDRWGGWEQQQERWSRRFERNTISDLDTASKPSVRSLSREVTANVSLSAGANHRANRKYAIQVTAGQTAKHASFVERVFLPSSFAVSLAHQRLVAGTRSAIPGVGEGWEGLMHVLRDPARRLEFSIDLPFPLRNDHVMDIRAYVDRDGMLEEDASLFDFSPAHSATNFPARRISVSIENPMVGVAYVVRWQLPQEDPLTPWSDPDGLNPHREWAEECRTVTLMRTKPKKAENMHRWLSEELSRVLGEHGQLIGAPRVDELRWSVYVVNRPLGEREIGGERPVLVPVVASRQIDAGWTCWPVGRGIAGRAYARKQMIKEVPGSRTRSPGHRDLEEEWMQTGVDAYEAPDTPLLPHSVLYGIPMYGPESSHWVWGVFCIGSCKTTPRLNLDAEIPRRTAASPATALEDVQRVLRHFAIWLADV